MVKRVTLSVSDEFYEEMAKWRDSLNFSKVFRVATIDAIKKKKAFKKRLKEGFDMEATIERLREEKLEVEGDYLTEGKESGLEWAKIAHYSELQYVLNEWEWTRGDDPTRHPEEMEGLGEEFRDMIENDPNLGFDHRGETTEAQDDLTEGWIEGVKSFWNEIEDKI